MPDYAIPVDWREARALVEVRLAEWGADHYQQAVVWSIAEHESTVAALQYIEAMRGLEVGDGAVTTD
jgi:hypothetical protein